MTSLEQFDRAEITYDIKYSELIASSYLGEAPEYEHWNPEQYQQKLFVASTKYRRMSAQHILLEDFESARDTLRQAAICYNKAKSSYALLVFALANNFNQSSENLPNYLLIDKKPVPADIQVQLIYALVYWGYEQKTIPGVTRYYDIKGIYKAMSALKGTGIGVLGIDIMFYLDVFNYFYPALNKGEVLSLAQILRPFFCLYDHALRLAKSIRHNWINLTMPFHPAEIDILAILHLISTVDTLAFDQELNAAPMISESKDNLKIFLKGLSQ